jgi:hypothetical protein
VEKIVALIDYYLIYALKYKFETLMKTPVTLALIANFLFLVIYIILKRKGEKARFFTGGVVTNHFKLYRIANKMEDGFYKVACKALVITSVLVSIVFIYFAFIEMKNFAEQNTL